MPAALFTAADLAERLGGRLDGVGAIGVRGVNALADAGQDEVTFLADEKHARRWGNSRAGVAVISEGLVASGHDGTRRALIVVPNASLAVARLLELFAPPETRPGIGVDPSAVVHPSARLGRDVRIGPLVTIESGCAIGDEVTIHAGVRLAAEVVIGDRTTLYENVVVRDRCRIGRDVILHGNIVIGTDGFGYRPDAAGHLVKMPHVGIVEIEDAVEVGAGSCIDRAKFGVTRIGAGTKIDNLVQIGHNCRLGRDVVIAGQAGLAGSVKVGDGAQIGGHAGIAEHLEIGAGARVAGFSAVIGDVPEGTTCFGVPALPGAETLRSVATIRKLPGLLQRLETRIRAENPSASAATNPDGSSH